MKIVILVDAGPLTALLNRNDQHHRWSVEQFGKTPPGLFTCEAVLAEAAYLLRKYSEGPQALLELVVRKVVAPSFSLEAEATAVKRLMKKYEDMPMSLADACLVRMAELHSPCRLMTVDSDFTIYRMRGGRRIPLIAPF